MIAWTVRVRPVTDKLLEEMTQAIVQEVDPERIILFGSCGRGNAEPGSDVDLIVVQREPFDASRNRRRETARIRRALWPFRVPTDILVYSVSEMAKWRNSLNHVLACGLREGRLLYARS